MDELTGKKAAAAQVFLGEDKILRITIDLNAPDGLETEGRVGAYGIIRWGEEIVTRFFDIKERNLAKQRAFEAEKKAKLGVIMPTSTILPS
jgi:hypothetical protein